MRKRILSLMLTLLTVIMLMPAAFAAAPALPDGFKWVVEPDKYSYIYPFHEGLANAATHDNKQVFIDTSGNIAISADKLANYDYASGNFSDGLCRVYKDGKTGFIDKTGKLVIGFDKAVENKYFFGDLGFSDGLILVTDQPTGGHVIPELKRAFVDKTGNFAMDFNRFKGYGISSFSDGLAHVVNTQTEASYFINTSGNIVIDADKLTDYGAFGFSDGLCRVRKFMTYGFIDKAGNISISFDKLKDYNYVEDFYNGLALVTIRYDKTYGFIDKTGNLVSSFNLPANYEYIDYCSSDGLTAVAGIRDGVLRIGYVDNSGKEKLVASLKRDAWASLTTPSGYRFNNGVAVMRTDDGWGVIAKVAPPLTAAPNKAKVFVDGIEVAFDAYTINQENYIKLRDVAYTLNGTRVIDTTQPYTA